jgi:sirohydrochlorin ferrochelatase
VKVLDTELILFAHGSPVESANEAVRSVARAMAHEGRCKVEAAFLEGGTPDLLGAISAASSRGAKRVIVVPYFLTTGLHLTRDLPELMRQAVTAHPMLRIEATPPLDGHPALVSILLDRAAAILHGN